jgi:hypothetical protein
MIYESHPWKQDLIDKKLQIQKYNTSKYFNGDNDDQAYTAIEKGIFYSAFIIRKLIDCKCKVSNEVDNYTLSLRAFTPKRQIDLLHRWPDGENFDFNNPQLHIKTGTQVCNWLIHSYVFCLCHDEHGTVDSFLVSSDYDSNKVLYCVDLNDWLDYMDFVGTDDIVVMEMKRCEYQKTIDYTLTKKERG